MQRPTPHLHLIQTPQVAQRLAPGILSSIEILTLPIDRLEEWIQQKVDENPALSIVTQKKTPEWRLFEHTTPHLPSLYQYLLNQAWQVFEKEEMPICEMIAGSLDDKGFITATTQDIAHWCNVSLTQVERVLTNFQSLDPLGIATQNAQEALLLQAKNAGYDEAVILLSNHYNDLIHQRFVIIAKQMKISEERVHTIVHKQIRRLNPFPGSGYDTTPIIVQMPELVLDFNGTWQITSRDSSLPTLEISEIFKKTAHPWERCKLAEAEHLIAALTHRKQLLFRVMAYLAEMQGAYLRGDTNELQPLYLSQVAKDLQVAPSSVSRIIKDKLIESPRGYVWLRSLFSYNVGEQDISKQRAKQLLLQLLRSEKGKCARGDQELAMLLKKHHALSLSRRTVAKYRKELGIPANTNRKK